MVLAGEYTGAEQRARFRTEAEAFARLQHPHIVQIYEVGEQDGRPYFSLEFIEGGSLDQKLQGVPQPAHEAARLLETLARTIHAAHQRGIVHRDLKPANVLLAADGTPKITDFGLAKQLDSEARRTHSGAILGTPSYMAPEQAEGRSREISPATDVYALGAILYELLTGRPPFRGPTLLDTLEQVRSLEPVPPSHLQPKVPRDLETICLQALNKDPARRYGSAAALADDLHRFLAGEPIAGRRPSIVAQAARWLRRPERIRDAGVIMILNGVVRTGLAFSALTTFAANASAGTIDAARCALLVWVWALCLVLFWAGWRAMQHNWVALCGGLVVALVYLATKLPVIWISQDPGGQGLPAALVTVLTLNSYLFGVQTVACLMALWALYSVPVVPPPAPRAGEPGGINGGGPLGADPTR
jgi:serine/threonine-protein kinase